MGVKQIFKSGLTDIFYYTSASQAWIEQPGTIRCENNNVYKYVAFSGTTSVAAGDVVCYVAAASDGVEQIVDGANTALGAGVAQAAVTPGTKTSGTVAYASGWVLIKGYTAVSATIGGTPTFGQSLTTGGATAPATTLITAATQQCVAYFYATKQLIADFPY